MAMTPQELRRRKLNLLMGMSYAAFASSKAWTPLQLFAAGEIGAWYDPSDLSTLFQDSAGSTPVTEVEQPVGMIRDKSGRGNHATQSTAASRPVLSARVNMLIYSEQIDNAAWAKPASTVTQNLETAPDGTLTADKVIPDATLGAHSVQQTPTVTSGTTYTLSYYAKEAGYRYVAHLLVTAGFGSNIQDIFDLRTGTVTVNNSGTASITAVGNGWYRCSVTRAATATAASLFQIRVFDNSTGVSFSGDTVSGVYVWGVDFRPSNEGVGIPPYQRIEATNSYDTAGFRYYLRFDGVDDNLVTGAITPTTDKVQVFAGIRKISDAAQAVVAELSASVALNDGTFALTAPDSAAANYNFSSKGTVQTDNIVTTYTAPLTSVVTGLSDISGASNLIRVNNAQVGAVLTTQGTGNFASQPLYIGERGGTTLPFNGKLFGLIVRFSGANLNTSVINQTEAWLNNKTAAY